MKIHRRSWEHLVLYCRYFVNLQINLTFIRYPSQGLKGSLISQGWMKGALIRRRIIQKFQAQETRNPMRQTSLHIEEDQSKKCRGKTPFL